MENQKRRIYVDGVWDLFHAGHVKQLRNLKYLDNRENILVVGIISDDDAEGYKRRPLIDEKNRTLMLQSCRYVDEVVEYAPLVMTERFILDHNIDLVCHGFSSKEDEEKQAPFFEAPIKMGRFRGVPYNKGISTTNIINKVKNTHL